MQRPDDKPEAVSTRLINYDKLTAPVIDYYQGLGIVARFAGTESNKIYPEVKKFLSTTKLKAKK
jgi:adenylate kinase family enzyme